MEAELAKQRGARAPAEVRELYLDNVKAAPQLAGLHAGYTELRTLSLTNTGLATLDHFPHLPKLTRVWWARAPGQGRAGRKGRACGGSGRMWT